MSDRPWYQPVQKSYASALMASTAPSSPDIQESPRPKTPEDISPLASQATEPKQDDRLFAFQDKFGGEDGAISPSTAISSHAPDEGTSASSVPLWSPSWRRGAGSSISDTPTSQAYGSKRFFSAPMPTGMRDYSNNSPSTRRNPEKIYCDYWIQHGSCAFHPNCIYKHVMPKASILEELRGSDQIPDWYVRSTSQFFIRLQDKASKSLVDLRGQVENLSYAQEQRVREVAADIFCEILSGALDGVTDKIKAAIKG
ncbi:hypothetical protein EJ08DRAFT_108512 [Tothia fuscella]|uniref:C3H1-type domain-containing protein n=1 Tax=Tothia fuscella TaxID=1048955 RepID=A0A9P4U0E0_9PEZI|nr:hypothetical protein EJ08DRAFT_108512 [Tothia fuscella]